MIDDKKSKIKPNRTEKENVDSLFVYGDETFALFSNLYKNLFNFSSTFNSLNLLVAKFYNKFKILNLKFYLSF